MPDFVDAPLDIAVVYPFVDEAEDGLAVAEIFVPIDLIALAVVEVDVEIGRKYG
jgi:hypothetical protein